MKDMLNIIKEALAENEVIKSECENRIKSYIYPEGEDTDNPFITIRPLDSPIATNYASDKNLSFKFYYQIDVQSYDRMKCKTIQSAVKEEMESLGFSQQANGLDNYFEETKRFVDARRYFTQTKLYDTDY